MSSPLTNLRCTCKPEEAVHAGDGTCGHCLLQFVSLPGPDEAFVTKASPIYKAPKGEVAQVHRDIMPRPRAWLCNCNHCESRGGTLYLAEAKNGKQYRKWCPECKTCVGAKSTHVCRALQSDTGLTGRSVTSAVPPAPVQLPSEDQISLDELAALVPEALAQEVVKAMADEAAVTEADDYEAFANGALNFAELEMPAAVPPSPSTPDTEAAPAPFEAPQPPTTALQESQSTAAPGSPFDYAREMDSITALNTELTTNVLAAQRGEISHEEYRETKRRMLNSMGPSYRSLSAGCDDEESDEGEEYDGVYNAAMPGCYSSSSPLSRADDEEERPDAFSMQSMYRSLSAA